jgi:hypothetical protein
MGHEANHSPPPMVKVKKEWTYTSTTPYIFMAWILIMYQRKFTDILHPPHKNKINKKVSF